MMGWVYVISHVRNISTDKSVSQQLRKARRIVRFGLSVRSQLRTCISPPHFSANRRGYLKCICIYQQAPPARVRDTCCQNGGRLPRSVQSSWIFVSDVYCIWRVE